MNYTEKNMKHQERIFHVFKFVYNSAYYITDKINEIVNQKVAKALLNVEILIQI